MNRPKTVLTTLLFCLAFVSTAAADQLWQLSPFTGDAIGVDVLVSNDALAQTLTIKASVTPAGGNTLGDLRALFFNIDGGIAGVTADMFTSPDVGSFEVCLGSGITSCGSPSNNLNGAPSGLFPAGSFQVGIDIGSPGIGSDDYQMATFLFNYGALGLTEDDIGPFAARVTSVGVEDDRDGSSKLFDNDGPTTPPDVEEPIPEPTTWSMMALGAGLVAITRLRRKR